MRAALKGVAAIVAALVVLLTLFALWIWNTTRLPIDLPLPTAEPRGDTELTEFYAGPSELPMNPGILIAQEGIDGPAVLAGASENVRILYSSTDGLDGRTINSVSGAVYLPKGEVPEGGWPLLVWSHGTVGIADICAPSYAGRGDRDRTYLNPWLKKGYAVAASDYQGLGTAGTHPYMDARTMAFNNLDLIRSVQSAGLPVGSKVVIAGQSQGATGAIATASYRKDYAADVDLVGVIATGIPYFSESVMWDLVVNSDRDEVSASVPLSLYMLTYAEMLDPDFALDQVISEQARSVVNTIEQSCVFDFIAASQDAGLSSNTTFTSRTEIPLLKVLDRAGLYTLDFDTPIFAGSGTVDKITPFSMQQEFLNDACDAGLTVSARTYDGANHNQGLLQSSSEAQEFAQMAFAGQKIKNTCPN